MLHSAGNGRGRVDIAGAGTVCQAPCQGQALDTTGGAPLELTAVADGDSSFAGWYGACRGAGSTCKLEAGTTGEIVAHFSAGITPDDYCRSLQRTFNRAASHSRTCQEGTAPSAPSPACMAEEEAQQAAAGALFDCLAAKGPVSCDAALATDAGAAGALQRCRLAIDESDFDCARDLAGSLRAACTAYLTAECGPPPEYEELCKEGEGG